MEDPDVLAAMLSDVGLDERSKKGPITSTLTKTRWNLARVLLVAFISTL